MDPLDVDFEAGHESACDGEVRLGSHQVASQEFVREFEFGVGHISTVRAAVVRVYAPIRSPSYIGSSTVTFSGGTVTGDPQGPASSASTQRESLTAERLVESWPPFLMWVSGVVRAAA
jgi:hypothetical protein